MNIEIIPAIADDAITLAYMEKKISLNTEKFTGKAQAYAKARPGYPEEAVEYIYSLVPQNAVFADVGAGTGKFTQLLAARGYTVFAVEPYADMREQLTVTFASFPTLWRTHDERYNLSPRQLYI